jgi:hypothetical protein
MNPPEYTTIANELLPRFTFKIGKFLTYDNDGLARLCQLLDDIEKYKTESNKDDLNLYFNQNIANMIDVAYEWLDKPHMQKSVLALVEDYNANIRMPTNTINMLLSHIWEDLQAAKLDTEIVTSASEVITCTKKAFDVITQSVNIWLSANKAHYVIL